MSNYSIYRTGWDINADQARSDAKSTVTIEARNFADAVPQEINPQILRMQQHMRMYEKLYGYNQNTQVQAEAPVEQTDVQTPVFDENCCDAPVNGAEQTVSATELEMIETLGASVEMMHNDENGNIGDEEETQQASEEQLLGEGRNIGAVIEEVKKRKTERTAKKEVKAEKETAEKPKKKASAKKASEPKKKSTKKTK